MSSESLERTHSAEETFAVGERLGRALGERGVIWLRGPLGAGKTVIAKGIFAAFGISPERVTSPSFSLINRYREDPPLHHIDLFRLERVEELADLGLDDLLEEAGVTVIEWPERLEGTAAGPDLDIMLEPIEESVRSIAITWRSKRASR